MPALWRPFYFEGIATYSRDVQVTFHGEGSDQFTRALPYVAQELEVPVYFVSRFLEEFPSCSDGSICEENVK